MLERYHTHVHSDHRNRRGSPAASAAAAVAWPTWLSNVVLLLGQLISTCDGWNRPSACCVERWLSAEPRFFPVKRMPFAEFCDREYEITSPGVHRALWEEFERHVIFSLVNHGEFNPNRRDRIAGARPRKVLAAAREALQFKRMPAQSSSARVNQNLFYANLEARKPQQSPPQNAARVQTHQAGPLVAADTAASDTATSLSSPPPPSLTEAEGCTFSNLDW